LKRVSEKEPCRIADVTIKRLDNEYVFIIISLNGTSLAQEANGKKFQNRISKPKLSGALMEPLP